MSRRASRQAMAPALILFVGCGGESLTSTPSSAIQPPDYVVPESAVDLPVVAHPEYANWSKFPVGIVVVRKKEVSNQFGTVRVTTKLRLTEKSADRVVVESQVTVDQSGSDLVENPSQSTAYP